MSCSAQRWRACAASAAPRVPPRPPLNARPAALRALTSQAQQRKTSSHCETFGTGRCTDLRHVNNVMLLSKTDTPKWKWRGRGRGGATRGIGGEASRKRSLAHFALKNLEVHASAGGGIPILESKNQVPRVLTFNISRCHSTGSRGGILPPRGKLSCTSWTSR